MPIETQRKVKRVLVMLDYGDNQTDSGEVFDLTELTRELSLRKNDSGNGLSGHARIELAVECGPDYSANGTLDTHAGKMVYPRKLEASWNCMVNFHSSGRTAHLDDAINASLPDSFTTQDLRKKLKRVQEKAKKLEGDIMAQRLQDAAAVRSQFPIARVTSTPLLDVPTQS